MNKRHRNRHKTVAAIWMPIMALLPSIQSPSFASDTNPQSIESLKVAAGTSTEKSVPNKSSSEKSSPDKQSTDKPSTDKPVTVTEHKKVVGLNEEGVSALAQQDYSAAIKQFKEALDLDAHYASAQANLVAAYNAYGLSLKAKPKLAIVQFHHALILDKHEPSTQRNIDALIKSMGLNPRSVDNRVQLADEAQANGDQDGVGLEMEAADYLRSHPNQNAVYGDAEPTKTK